MIRSFWFAALLAALLGAGTCAVVLVIRWNHLVEPLASDSPSKGLVTMRERGWDFWSEGIDKLSADLTDERASLDARRKDLETLEVRLAAEKQELLRLRAEVEAIRDGISKQIPLLLSSEKANLKALSRTYATMRAPQAVAILSEMNDVNAVKILALMKPDVVGAILQEMAVPGKGVPPMTARAARLSDQLRLLNQEEQPEAP